MQAAVPRPRDIRNGRTIFFGDDPANVVMAADVVGLADIPETFRKMGFQGMGHQLGIGFCARPATATSAVTLTLFAPLRPFREFSGRTRSKKLRPILWR
jgi:hypothetical protein